MTYDFSNPQTDPMHGDEQTQAAYRQHIDRIIDEEREKVRQDHARPVQFEEQDPVMIGQAGMPGGLSTSG